MNEDFFKKGMKNLEDFLRDFGIAGVPIPSQLESVYLGGPFTTCVGCNENILEPPRIYEVQKVFKGREVILEYALCDQCGEALMKEYSRESMEAIQKYVAEHFFPSFSLDQCHLCHGPREGEYALLALCRGARMISSFAMCHKCMEDMESLLSQKTRERMKEFMDDKFPGIPAEFNPVTLLGV